MAGSHIAPLNDDDYHKINEQLGNLARLNQDIQTAGRAGCDITDKSSACNKLMDQLETIKRAYFPNKP